MLLNIVLAGMIVLMLHTNQSISYAGYVIYLVALYDFILIGTAITNALKYRKSDNPILLASKFINLTVAMISMLSLEVAMINRFGSDMNLKTSMTGSMGIVICLINFIMAIYMIVKSRRKLVV